MVIFPYSRKCLGKKVIRKVFMALIMMLTAPAYWFALVHLCNLSTSLVKTAGRSGNTPSLTILEQRMCQFLFILQRVIDLKWW